jgi:hypothetical protein
LVFYLYIDQTSSKSLQELKFLRNKYNLALYELQSKDKRILDLETKFKQCGNDENKFEISHSEGQKNFNYTETLFVKSEPLIEGTVLTEQEDMPNLHSEIVIKEELQTKETIFAEPLK